MACERRVILRGEYYLLTKITFMCKYEVLSLSQENLIF